MRQSASVEIMRFKRNLVGQRVTKKCGSTTSPQHYLLEICPIKMADSAESFQFLFSCGVDQPIHYLLSQVTTPRGGVEHPLTLQMPKALRSSPHMQNMHDIKWVISLGLYHRGKGNTGRGMYTVSTGLLNCICHPQRFVGLTSNRCPSNLSPQWIWSTFRDGFGQLALINSELYYLHIWTQYHTYLSTNITLSNSNLIYTCFLWLKVYLDPWQPWASTRISVEICPIILEHLGIDYLHHTYVCTYIADHYQMM